MSEKGNKENSSRLAKEGVDLKCKSWSSENHTIETSKKEGYLFRITLTSRVPLSPDQMMSLMTNPTNENIFQDLHNTKYYKLLECDGNGYQTLDVIQEAALRFMIIPIYFTIHLRIEANYREHWFKFKLNKWGTMRKFEGEWRFAPIYLGDKIIGTNAILVQDVMPLIVPPFLSSFLQGIATNTVIHFVKDIEEVIRRYKEGEPFKKILTEEKLENNEWLKKWRDAKDKDWRDWQINTLANNFLENGKNPSAINSNSSYNSFELQSSEYIES